MDASADDALFAAAHVGDAARLALLLQQRNRNVNARDPIRDTPLLVACQRGHVVAVETLVAGGADPNLFYAYSTPPLAVAAELGNAAMVQCLLGAGARVDHANTWGATALHIACGRGFVDVVNALLAAGADPKARDKTGSSARREAEKNGHKEVLRALRDHRLVLSSSSTSSESSLNGGDDRRTEASVANGLRPSASTNALDRAVSKGQIDVVRNLVNCGASLRKVSSDRSTVLHRAVSSKNLQMVEYLLRQDVDIDAADAAGWTALHHAVRDKCVDIVAELLNRGADVNLQTKGRRGKPTERYEMTALHLAVRADDTTVLSKLLSCAGVDLNLPNDQGRTPLVYAVALDRGDAVSLLIHAGANVNIRADAGESALLVASYRGRTDDVYALLRAGARTDVVAYSGRTPMSVAKSPEQREVIEVYHTSQLFHDKCFALMNPHGEAPTIPKLKELVPLITSVYDLRHILTLVMMCDPAENIVATRELLNVTFHHIVDKKLTFDDDACVFFKLCLERCDRDKLLLREDFLLLDRKAEKANTESADWVTQLKQQVYTNSWRLDAHDQHLHTVVNGLKEVHLMVMENRQVIVNVTNRVGSLQQQVDEGKMLLAQLQGSVNRVNVDLSRFERRLNEGEEHLLNVASSLTHFRQAYVDRIKQEERNQKIKRVVGIVASVAGFVFAPVLKEVAGAVVDFINPIDIVEKVYGQVDIAGFLSDQGGKALPMAIQAQLEKFAIPEDDFEAILREEIVLQHPEYLEECIARGLTVDVDGGRSDIARQLEASVVQEQSAMLQIVGELKALCGLPATTIEPTPSYSRDPIVSQTASFESLRLNVGSNNHSVPHSNGGPHYQHSHPVAHSNGSTNSQNNHPVAYSNGSTNYQYDESTLTNSNSSTVHSDSLSPREEPASAAGDVVFLDDVDGFEYHAAVHESGGDESVFKGFTSVINPKTCDPMATMTMELRHVATSTQSLCAAEYAYRCGYTALGDYIASRMNSPPSFNKAPAISVSLDEDPEEFPAIMAVDESEGHIEEFQRFMTVVDGPLDATIQATVVERTAETGQWTALDYACHLGYEAIVGCMLREIYTFPARTKFQLLRRVSDRAKQLSDSTTTQAQAV